MPLPYAFLPLLVDNVKADVVHVSTELLCATFLRRYGDLASRSHADSSVLDIMKEIALLLVG